MLLLAVAVPARIGAQQVQTFELRWDNDFLALRGGGKPDDRDYTQGLEIAVALRHDSAGGAEYRVALGQRIYTPRFDGDEPVAGERPYAGWLYASVARRVTSPRAAYTLAAEAGVTGPPALGEQVQNGVHRLTRSERQQGWSNQLAFEPAFVVRARAELVRHVRGVEVRPYGEVGAGTLWDGAAVGVRTGSGGGRGFYADAGARAEWVARDLFLDGNTFTTSVRADRRPLVAAGDAAAGYRWRQGWVEYRMSMRSREYAAQRAPHRYGSLAFGWRR
ncbi:MAG TPA: lipid A deacylase LpxR family protein [Longimicrobium sp.]|nr:lipid A deacylase LpxR family protein [Longimicrobium sp.]